MERMTLNPAICEAMHGLNQALYETSREGATPIDHATLRALCDDVLNRMKGPDFTEVTDCARALLRVLDDYDACRKAGFEKAARDYHAICEAFGVRPTLVPGL
ncbi:MAG: hypothetical protein WA001_01090 [Patescibacteria group bacterium]